jgi:hypothetical protein
VFEIVGCWTSGGVPSLFMQIPPTMKDFRVIRDVTPTYGDKAGFVGRFDSVMPELTNYDLNSHKPLCPSANRKLLAVRSF